MREKQLYGRFKWLINNISNQKTWTWLRKGNFMRETESLLIAAQDNAIRTNLIKARKDKTQQNSKCRLCSDRDEMINHIISECSKLAQKKYTTRYNWVGKVFQWEMCQKFKFDYTNKWYMHNTAPVLENDTNKFLWDFNIQTDHLIPARRPDLIILNKKKKRICKIVDLAVPAYHRTNLKECEKNISSSTLLENWKSCGTWKWLSKGLEDMEVGGRVDSIRMTALLRTDHEIPIGRLDVLIRMPNRDNPE